MWYVLGGMVVGVVMIVAAEVCVAKYAQKGTQIC